MANSTRVTGNDPLEGVDPGGTKPTSAGNRAKQQGADPAAPAPAAPHKVQSGDRNTVNDAQGTQQDADSRKDPDRKA